MSFKQWYAMRSNLKGKGKWTGRATHKVAAQEDGEPPTKKVALEPTPEPEGESPASDPEEGTSKAAQGKSTFIL